MINGTVHTDTFIIISSMLFQNTFSNREGVEKNNTTVSLFNKMLQPAIG